MINPWTIIGWIILGVIALGVTILLIAFICVAIKEIIASVKDAIENAKYRKQQKAIEELKKED